MTRRTCVEPVGLLHDYLDDALPPGLRQRVTRHLHSCADCDGVLAGIRSTRRLLHHLARTSMPDAMKHTLLQAFYQRQRTPIKP